MAPTTKLRRELASRPLDELESKQGICTTVQMEGDDAVDTWNVVEAAARRESEMASKVTRS